MKQDILKMEHSYSDFLIQIINPKNTKKREGRDIFFPNFYWINATTGQWSVNYTHWKNTFLYLDKHLGKYCVSYF